VTRDMCGLKVVARSGFLLGQWACSRLHGAWRGKMDGVRKSAIVCVGSVGGRTCLGVRIGMLRVRRGRVGRLLLGRPSRRMGCQSDIRKLGIVLRYAAPVTSLRLAPFGRERMHLRLQNVVVVLGGEEELQDVGGRGVQCGES
jgi:hypothetical protein